MIFKAGDMYIHFTKHGGVNKGIVKSVGVINSIDATNGVEYEKHYIKTTKNYLLELDGDDGKVYKVTKEMSDEDVVNWKRFNELARTHKERYLKKKNAKKNNIS